MSLDSKSVGRTAGSSLSHFFPNLSNRLKILGFRPWRIMPLACSSCPLVFGWATTAQYKHMWCLSDKSNNFLKVNYVPLSVMMELGTQNRWIIFVKNIAACSDLIFMMGWTSIHLENLSIATSRWVKPSGTIYRCRTRSRPQTAKG